MSVLYNNRNEEAAKDSLDGLAGLIAGYLPNESMVTVAIASAECKGIKFASIRVGDEKGPYVLDEIFAEQRIECAIEQMRAGDGMCFDANRYPIMIYSARNHLGDKFYIAISINIYENLQVDELYMIREIARYINNSLQPTPHGGSLCVEFVYGVLVYPSSIHGLSFG